MFTSLSVGRIITEPSQSGKHMSARLSKHCRDNNWGDECCCCCCCRPPNSQAATGRTGTPTAASEKSKTSAVNFAVGRHACVYARSKLSPRDLFVWILCMRTDKYIIQGNYWHCQYHASWVNKEDVKRNGYLRTGTLPLSRLLEISQTFDFFFFFSSGWSNCKLSHVKSIHNNNDD